MNEIKIGQFTNCVTIPTPKQKSLYHCICNASFLDYRRGLDRDKIVDNLIDDIASKIDDPNIRALILTGEMSENPLMKLILEILPINIITITNDVKIYKYCEDKLEMKKDRNTIVIKLDPVSSRFTLIGMKFDDKDVATIFKFDHPLVKFLTNIQ